MECLEQFTEDRCFSSLARNIEAADYEQAFQDAHALKGVAGNLGLTPLYQSICDIVEILRHKEYENIEEYCTHVEEFYQVFKEKMAEK